MKGFLQFQMILAMISKNEMRGHTNELVFFFNFYERLREIIMIDTTEIFLAINSIRKNEKKKPSKSNIYQQLQKDEKQKGLEYEKFDQVIENLLLSGTILTKTKKVKKVKA